MTCELMVLVLSWTLMAVTGLFLAIVYFFIAPLRRHYHWRKNPAKKTTEDEPIGKEDHDR